jgi:5-methyltetrahydrofolate--homocysteine methyltransferase
MMGTKPQAALEAARNLDPAPIAFGANCGSHPRQLVETIVQLAEAAEPGDVIIAKGNCGVPKLTEDGIQYDGTPAVMADYAQLVRDAGASIIGGCCGTTAAHLAFIREALDERSAGAKPDAARIEQIFGPAVG